jgi:hypothetical protein
LTRCRLDIGRDNFMNWMQEGRASTPVPITPAQSPALTFSIRTPSQTAAPASTAPTTRTTNNQACVSAHQNNIFSQNTFTPTRGASVPVTPRPAAKTPGTTSWTSSRGTSTPSTVCSIAAQSSSTSDALPEWAAPLLLQPEELAKVKVKVYDFKQSYYYVRGHVFTLW